MKRGHVQQITEILNPILDGKCGALLALDILNVINELQPEVDNVNKVKERLIKEYAIMNEDGTMLIKKLDTGEEIYDFQDNEEKINMEMAELMESEFEIKSQINMKNFDNDVKIEPIKLKLLYDFNLLV
jgi:hypothetical protein